MYLLMLLLIAVMYLMNIIELFSLTRSYTLINKKLYPVIQKCYTYFWTTNTLRLIFIFSLLKDFNIHDSVLIKSSPTS